MKRDVFDRLIKGIIEIQTQALFDKTLTFDIFRTTNKGYLIIKTSGELSSYCFDVLLKLDWIQGDEENVWYFDVN